MGMPLVLPPPEAWAEQTFGAVQLGDRRRTRRAVALARAMARRPDASLPAQVAAPAALKAAYRFLDAAEVTLPALLAPHWRQTRQAAGQQPVALLVQDTTTLDYSHHPTTTGLGPIGNGRGQGLLVQSILAVVPHPRRVLGLAHLEPFRRQPAPKGEDCATRQRRARESEVWPRAVAAVGPPPPGARWVHVGDRGGDIFAFLAACRQRGADFLVRAAQSRRVEVAEGPAYLLPYARGLPARATRALELPARHGQPARRATVALSYGPLTLRPPKHSPKQAPLAAWVVRVWEPAPPPGVRALEWLLVTSVPTATVEAAWERAEWYTCRWLVEDYHQCLKTGCGIERRQVQTGARLQRLLGLCAPLAVRLLQLREAARLAPERPAHEVLPREVVAVVAALAGLSPVRLTAGACWRAIARLGGHQGRRRDGPPGWQTLWRGWHYVETVLTGVQLAPHLQG